MEADTIEQDVPCLEARVWMWWIHYTITPRVQPSTVMAVAPWQWRGRKQMPVNTSTSQSYHHHQSLQSGDTHLVTVSWCNQCSVSLSVSLPGASKHQVSAYCSHQASLYTFNVNCFCFVTLVISPWLVNVSVMQLASIWLNTAFSYKQWHFRMNEVHGGKTNKCQKIFY